MSVNELLAIFTAAASGATAIGNIILFSKADGTIRKQNDTMQKFIDSTNQQTTARSDDLKILAERDSKSQEVMAAALKQVGSLAESIVAKM